MSSDLSRFGLVCPTCHGSLVFSEEGARCDECKLSYAVESGIPVLLDERSQSSARDEQASWFDGHVNEAYEVSRPHGAPRLHRWLLDEKFRRATRGLDLSGSNVLAVCGGSGLDAEFLARAGATVISADVSLGAARRARERSARFNVPITPIVADAEVLPFGDRSVDIVYVHDGLHHVDRPDRALEEMMRVAGKAVSITEPANARVTRLAVGIGLAVDREEAGNVVARLDLPNLVRALEQSDFRVLVAERYGMYYSHVPGLPSTVLSRPAAFGVATAAFRVGNRLAGRFGNKLAVVAVRR